MTMKLKRPGPCQYALTASLEPHAVLPVRENVVAEVQREATIAGFRKGKAPRDLIEQRYSEKIHEETIQRLTKQVVQQATTEHKLKPVGPFQVTRVNFTDAKGFELEAKVEVEPEFRLSEYRNIRLKKRPITVAPNEVDEAVTQLQESMAELVPTAEGQEKEKKIPQRDDEFAKDVGFENLVKLEAHIQARLREQKTAAQQQHLEQALCDTVLARHTFEVPAGLVAKQSERLKRDFQARLVLNGLPEDKAKQELEKNTEQVKSNALRNVKLSFVLERIAEREQLSVTQDELVDRLWKLSKQWGKDPAEVRRLLDAQGLWASVVSSVRHEKTMAFLLSVAHIEDIEGREGNG